MALHGPTIKAATTRNVMPFLTVLANEHLQNIRGDMDHALMHMLIEHVLELNRLNYTTGVFFTQEQLEAYEVATQNVGKFMQLRQKPKRSSSYSGT